MDAALGHPVRRGAEVRPEKPAFVELPVGSFFMVAKSILNKTGGLLRDNMFPIYCAEYDFFRRAKQAGLPILYLPQVQFVHNLGHAAKLRTSQENTVLMFGGLVRYCEEWNVHPKAFKILYTISTLVSPPFWLVSRVFRDKSSFRIRVGLSAIALAILWR